MSQTFSAYDHAWTHGTTNERTKAVSDSPNTECLWRLIADEGMKVTFTMWHLYCVCVHRWRTFRCSWRSARTTEYQRRISARLSICMKERTCRSSCLAYSALEPRFQRLFVNVYFFLRCCALLLSVRNALRAAYCKYVSVMHIVINVVIFGS